VAFLGFKQATFEDSALGDCHWHVLDAGLPTNVTTDPHSGDYCMQVVTSGANPTDGAKTPEAGITGITPTEICPLLLGLSSIIVGTGYSVSLWGRGAVGGETVQLAIRWFTAGSVFISEATYDMTLTAAWVQYKFENQPVPVGAAKASLQLRDGDAATWFIDDVCFEESNTCGDFITPYDADTFIVNNGHLVAHPTWTLTALDTLADGTGITIDGVEFDYEGALAIADALEVETDQQMPDVRKNAVRDWANVTSDPVMPTLSVGSNTVVMTDPTKVRLVGAYRERTW
jgi:hypothetical protein